MLSTGELGLITPHPCKTVQDQGIRVHDTPHGAILLDSLKTLEMQLQKRGIIPCPAMQAFNPLWFVAETERNVFLWRRGCSLIQQDEFEFWIDLPKLIDKRLHQLASQNDSPFVNPLWGISVLDKDSAKREQDYVRAFAEIQERISGHMNALSHIGSLLIRELVSAGDREVVVLPASPARAAGALPDAACQR